MSGPSLTTAGGECRLVLGELLMPSERSLGFVALILSKVKSDPDYATSFLLELEAAKERLPRTRYCKVSEESIAVKRLEAMLSEIGIAKGDQ